jgi:nucleoside-diphosphate-sugar epimerase
MKKEKVIVTGGSGLLGATVVHELVKEGSVVPVVMDIVENPARLNDIIDKIEYVQGDISDREHLDTVFEKYKPVRIYHIAAVLGDTCENNRDLAMNVNVNSHLALLDAALKHNVKQFLFSSSITTYGEDVEEGVELTLETVQHPASFYGVTKIFDELAGRYYKKRYGLDFRAIRYPGIVGPGLRASGISTYISAIIEMPAKGEPYVVKVGEDVKVPLLYVEDAGQAIIQLGKVPVENIKSVVYFINGVKEPVPNAGEMVEMVKNHIKGANITFDVNEEWDKLLKSASHMVDDSLSVKEWNWSPKYDTYDKIIDAYIKDLGL